MNIKEATDYKVWMEEIMKDPFMKSHKGDNRDRSYCDFFLLGKVELALRSWDKNVILDIDINDQSSDSIGFTMHDGRISTKSNHRNCVFQFDTCGIVLLARNLEKNNPTSWSQMVDVVIKTDVEYLDKYRGNLAGNKFGF